MRSRSPGFCVLPLLLLAMCACGCGFEDPDPIRQYTIDAPPAVDSFTPSPGSVAEAQRRPEAWFFKLMGPDERVVSQVGGFTQLVSSVRFGPDGKPVWTLPEGWSEKRETGMRYATLTPPGDAPLEVSVMSLPAEDPNSESYLLDNFNRWRKQVGLGELSEAAQLEDSRKSGELMQMDARGQRITLVNLSGEAKDSGKSRMLAAMIVGGKVSPPPAAASDKPFTVTLPTGWTEAPLKMFQKAAYAVSEGPETLSVSVSTAGGDLAANVNRWRGQVGLQSLSDQEIQGQAKPLKVDGTDASYFVVEGSDVSILGVIVPHGGQQWFIKATGPKDIAAKQRANFEAFVRSLKFTGL